jgi:hypothetical protein
VGQDKMLRTYNAETTELLAEIKAHDEFIKCVAFSPDANLTKLVLQSVDWVASEKTHAARPPKAASR